ncbi:MAG: competence/damage-inducible protein A [Candidatus Aminicenantales bacterium]
MKRVEILAIGSELLTPYFQDTNSLYLARRLNDLGLEVSFKTVVGDEQDNLRLKVEEALRKSDLILAMGGLGPTADDRTREAFSRVLEREIVMAPELLEKIEARFRRRGLSMPASNRKQAGLISGAEVLPNEHGTAPGQWLEWGSKIIILLPGPPHELEPMFEKYVIPRLESFRSGFLARRVLMIAGLTESMVEDLMADLYPDDPSIRITTLARPGQIELHLTAASSVSRAEASSRLEPLEQSLLDRLGDNVFSREGETLEEVLGGLLRLVKKTLSCAESCSGGLLSHRLTNVPGSSEYFLAGLVAYSNEAKEVLLAVPQDLLRKHGAVSGEVARAMAQGVRRAASSDFGLAVTGIAGPAGGTPEKPVGLVYTALAWDNGADVVRNLFLGSREIIKFQSSQKALDMLRRYLEASRR